MRDPRLASYLRVLGLPSRATFHDVQSAFRRLARMHHPDVNPFANRGRFVEVMRAYRALRDAYTEGGDASYGPCGRCGRHDELFDPLGHGGCCAECLLGETTRRRMLPGPRLVLVVAKHVTVIALYAISAVLLLRLPAEGDWTIAAVALCCAMAGFIVLTTEVLLAHER